jgi:two-component system response regulator MtrA
VATPRVNILVIDDSESVLETILTILELSSYQATGALSGEEGLASFQKGNFDLIVTDLEMPGISGFDVARAIKGMEVNIPVIMVSGSADELTPEKLRESGVDHILAKPFRPAELRRVINEALKRGNIQI